MVVPSVVLSDYRPLVASVAATKLVAPCTRSHTSSAPRAQVGPRVHEQPLRNPRQHEQWIGTVMIFGIGRLGTLVFA